MVEHIKYLNPQNLNLSQLYLDPENPRFIEDSEEISEQRDITSATIQEQAMMLLEDKYGIQTLQESIEKNGFLPIDRIVVKPIADKEGKFVVLEGNRRLAAAKKIKIKIDKGMEYPEYVKESLESISVLVYSGQDENAAWIFQGLRHISGIKDWSTIQKAKLLVTEMEEDDLNYTEVGKIFGISRVQAGQWARAYYAYEQISEIEEYAQDIDHKCFPLIQELFGRGAKSIQDWLNWNDENDEFDNEDNLLLYVDWLYPKINSSDEFDPDVRGNWENRRIVNAEDQRALSKAKSKFPTIFEDFVDNRINISSVKIKLAREEEVTSKNVQYYLNLIDEYIESLKSAPVLQLTDEVNIADLIQKLDELDSTVSRLKAQFNN
jgi:hypothetical protein